MKVLFPALTPVVWFPTNDCVWKYFNTWKFQDFSTGSAWNLELGQLKFHIKLLIWKYSFTLRDTGHKKGWLERIWENWASVNYKALLVTLHLNHYRCTSTLLNIWQKDYRTYLRKTCLSLNMSINTRKNTHIHILTILRLHLYAILIPHAPLDITIMAIWQLMHLGIPIYG